MAKVQTLRAFVNQRLSAAAEEIFERFERIIAEYEEELCGQRKLDTRPEVRSHRAEVQPLAVSREEVPPKQQESSPSLPVPPRDEKRFICSVCDKTFQSKGDAVKHMTVHTGGKQYSCSVCDSVFTGPLHLQNHLCEGRRSLQLHQSPTEQMDTEADGEDSGGPEPIRNTYPDGHLQPDSHDKTSHFSKPETVLEETREPQSGSSQLQNNIECNTGNKPFSCAECGKVFLKNSNLKRHMNTHTGNKTFSCSVCSKNFIHSESLTQHMSLHMEENGYICSACGKTLTSWPLLVKHRCVKRFPDLQRLTVQKNTGAEGENCGGPQPAWNSHPDGHLQPNIHDKTSHTEPETDNTLQNHKVPGCDRECNTGKTASSSSECATSSGTKETQTGGKPFSWSVCSTELRQKESLTLPMGEKRFWCKVCGESFTLSKLKYHHCVGRQSSQLHQSKTEENRDIELLKTKADGEDCGRLGPVRNSDPDGHLQPDTHDKTSHTEPETDNTGDWEEASEPWSGSDLLQNSEVPGSFQECSTGETSRRSSECATSSGHKGRLQEHNYILAGDGPFSCSVCSKNFSGRESLMQHMSLHDGEKRYWCKLCGGNFTWSMLKYHECAGQQSSHLHQSQTEQNRDAELVKTEADGEDCGGPGPVRYSDTEGHLQPASDDKTSHSSELGTDLNETCEPQSGLNTVQNNEIPGSGQECNTDKTSSRSSECASSSGHKRHLQEHNYALAVDGPFSCSVCNKNFIGRESLTQHMSLHAEEKQCWCSVCGESFTLSTLMYHQCAGQQSSNLHQIQTEQNRDGELVKTEADGEDCGGPEPVKNSDTEVHLQSAVDDETSHSFELGTDLNETCEPQSGFRISHTEGHLQSAVDDETSHSFELGTDLNETCEPQSGFRISDTEVHLQPAVDDETSHSFELGTDLNETCEPQSGLNHVQNNQIPGSGQECNTDKTSSRSPECASSSGHKETQTAKKPFSWSVFRTKFAQKESLTLPMIGKQYSCSVCSKSFTWWSQLKNHQCVDPQSSQLHQSQTEEMETEADVVDGGGPEPASNPDPERDLELNADDNTENSSDTETDESCDWEETRKPPSGSNPLHREVPVKDVERNSGKTSRSSTRSGLKRPLQKHNGLQKDEKPFSCSVCGKRYALKGSLTRHMRLHSGEKGFSCSVCKNTFLCREDLVRHKKIHTRKKKQYSCSVCRKRFTRPSQLKKHQCVGHHSSELHQRQTEENPDGEECGGPEPARNSDPDRPSHSATDDKMLPSSEVCASQEGEQLPGLEEADIIKFTFSPVSVKIEEDDEEKPQSSELHQRLTEQMETEAAGEDCGGPEPARNSDPDRPSHSANDDKMLPSSKLCASQEGEQLRGLEEADITKFTFTPVPVKSEEEDEEKPQSSQLHESLTEQMETEPDGKDCGGPEPARNSDPERHLQADTDEKKSHSPELGTSSEGEPLRGLEEADIIKFPFSPVSVKSEEDDEEKPQSSQLHESLTEQMETEPDGKDCGGPEPARNSDPDRHLQADTDDDQTENSSDPETDDNCGWEETREPPSGSNPRQNNEVPGERSTGKTSRSISEGAASSAHKGRLQKPNGRQTGEKPFSCSVCGKRYTLKGSLTRHMILHSEDKGFSCSVCKNTFLCREDLVRHKKIHKRKKKRYSCSVCGKRFTRRSQFKKHQCVGQSSHLHQGQTEQNRDAEPEPRTDTREPQSGSNPLQNNTESNTGEKPFSCAKCGKLFRKKSKMKTHMKIHTTDKLFSCSVCNKGFKLRIHLKKHKATHTKDYSCSVCGKRFTRRSKFKKHQCVGRQSSNLLQSQTEENRDEENLKAEADGEDCGGPEPARNSNKEGHLQPATDDKTSHFPEPMTELEEAGDLGRDEEHLKAEDDGEDCGGLEPARNSDTDLQPSTNDKTSHVSEPKTELEEKRGQGSKTEENRDEEYFKPEADGEDCGGPEPASNLDLQPTTDDKSSHLSEPKNYLEEAGDLGRDEEQETDGEDWEGLEPARNSDTDLQPSTNDKTSHVSEPKTELEETGEPQSGSNPVQNNTESNTGEKPFSCTECGKLFRKKSKMKTHMKIHTRDKRFSCSVCNKGFKLRKHLKEHKATHTKDYSCSACDKRFTRRSKFKKHQCVGRQSSNLLQNQTEENRDEENLKAEADREDCGGPEPDSNLDLQPASDDKSSDISEPKKDLEETGEPQPGLNPLQNHEVPEQGQECSTVKTSSSSSECATSSGHKGRVQKQNRVQREEMPFSCSVCGKGYLMKNSYMRHMRIHGEGEIFSCSLCKKTFNSKTGLSKHQKHDHTVEKPFTCSICGKGFELPKQLSRHMNLGLHLTVLS